MFSRTLLFRQILSGLKRFPVDELWNLQLVQIKTFSHGQTVTHNNLSVKYALFTDKLGLGDCLRNLFSSAVAYQ